MIYMKPIRNKRYNRNILKFAYFFRRWVCGQTVVDVMAEPHQLRQAGHHDEGHRRLQRPQGPHQGARPHRVLGQSDHLQHCPPLLSPRLLLDIQVCSSQKCLQFEFSRSEDDIFKKNNVK